MGRQDAGWTICHVASLVIVVSAVLVLSCRKHTNTQTRMNALLPRLSSAWVIIIIIIIIIINTWIVKKCVYIPTISNSLPSHVRSCETLTTFSRHLKSHFFHSALPTAFTHVSASDSFSTMALYKSIYLLTYLILIIIVNSNSIV